LPIAAEISRPLALDALPEEGVTVDLEASPDERGALAARFDLVALDRLVGEVRVRPADAGATVHVAGRLDADVVQRCVVTLEPVPAHVAAEFDRLFSRELPPHAQGEVEVDPEAELPEPLEGDRLDLGEILAEELSLALDPYPRSPEADRFLAEFEAEHGGGSRSPFAALAPLRRH
jgi:uncharacterized metal-binding protein YceD (DUF177 family)